MGFVCFVAGDTHSWTLQTWAGADLEEADAVAFEGETPLEGGERRPGYASLFLSSD